MGYIGSDPKTKESVSTSQLINDSVTNEKIVDDIQFNSVTSSIVSASADIIADTFSGTFSGALSSSAQIADNISGSFTPISSSVSSRLTLVEDGTTSKALVSASAISSAAQGQVTLTTNGVAATAVDLGLQSSDSPTFADVTVTGTLTAQEVHTEFESASILFSSGSTQFGNSSDDVHDFKGNTISGSVTSTGSFGRVHIGASSVVIEDNGSGALGFRTNNAERFSIASNGPVTFAENVNIDASRTLTVNGDLDVDGTANLDVVDIDGAVDMASTLAIGGNITLSKTADNTSAKLQVQGDFNNTTIQGASGNAGGLIVLRNSDSTDNNFSAINFQDANENTLSGILGVNKSHSSNQGEIVFFVRGDLHTDGDEAMRITHGGDVGIGTTAPESVVEIVGADSTQSGTARVQLTITDDAAYNSAQYSGIAFSQKWHSDGRDTPTSAIVGSRDSTSDGQYGGYLTFHTRTQGDNVAERMRIDSSGNVGIGTTSNDGHVHTYSDQRYMLYLQSTYGTSRKYWFRNDGGTLQIGEGAQGDSQVGYTFDTANKRFGIGTRSPDYFFDVESSGTTFMRLYSTATNGVAGLYMENDTVRWYVDAHGGVSDNFLIGEENVLSGTALSITTGAKVGIGTTAPTQALTVIGNISGSGEIKNSDGTKIYTNERFGKIKGNAGDTTSGAENTPHTETIDMPEGSHILTVMMHRTGVHILGTYMISVPPNASNVVNVAVTQLSYHAYGGASQIDVQNQNNSTAFGFNSNSDGIIKIIYTNDDDANWQYWSWSYTTLGVVRT